MRTVYLPRESACTGPLVLVNSAHPLRVRDKTALCAPDESRPGVLMERQAARLLQECIRKTGGWDMIVPVSGWRSYTEQQQIWDGSMAENGEAFTRKYVALPGCSEHQTGLAIDLALAAEEIDFIRPDFPYGGICGEFRRVCTAYGFIERYRRGKEELTGIAAEPWHFRYVGAPHAHLMEENGLCLEEYSAFIRSAPRSCTMPGGQTARVFHVPCAGETTELLLPDGCCQISGDNDGGFIVTAWGRSA